MDFSFWFIWLKNLLSVFIQILKINILSIDNLCLKMRRLSTPLKIISNMKIFWSRLLIIWWKMELILSLQYRNLKWMKSIKIIRNGVYNTFWWSFRHLIYSGYSWSGSIPILIFRILKGELRFIFFVCGIQKEVFSINLKMDYLKSAILKWNSFRELIVLNIFWKMGLLPTC